MSSAHRYSWTRSDGSVGKAYRAKWTGVDGKPKTRRGFDRKGDAEAFAADREAEARHGIALGVVRPTGKTTVEAWSKTWMESLEVRGSTADSYKYALKRINRTLGGRSLASLRTSELKAWRRSLTTKDGKALAHNTAEHTAAILAMLLRAAVADGLIPKSPLAPSRGGSGTGRVVDPDGLLTLEQIVAWGEAMPDVAKEMPLVAAMTGLRQGELLGLQASRVEFLRREITVDPLMGQMVTPIGKGHPEYGPPKTTAGARTVPLPALAKEALNRHLIVQPLIEGEPIFRGSRGQRWRRSTFGDVWRQARDDAKLPGWVHWHALRDFYASSLIRSGLDLRTVMTLMGHTSSEETLRVYARLWPDSQDRARQALEEVWSTDDNEDKGQGSTTGS